LREHRTAHRRTRYLVTVRYLNDDQRIEHLWGAKDLAEYLGYSTSHCLRELRKSGATQWELFTTLPNDWRKSVVIVKRVTGE